MPELLTFTQLLRKLIEVIISSLSHFKSAYSGR